MSNCRFLRQKKQVLLNGEWVDTRSFRYFPHCDDENAYVNIVNGRPGIHIDVRFVKIQDLDTFTGYNWNEKTAELNNKGEAYIEMGKDECIYDIKISDSAVGYSCEPQIQIHGCPIISIDSHDWTPKYVSCELSISCTRFVSASNAPNILRLGSAYSSITFTNFETSSLTRAAHMFLGCSSLRSLDVSSWNTSNVTDMSGMFADCSGLTSLDLSNFDTSNVTNFGVMFDGCSSLTNIDISNFNTSNGTTFGGMFFECSGLTSLDVSNFDTSNSVSFNIMFKGCSNLTHIDVSNFNTSNVVDMNGMFFGCSSLTYLNLSNFNTSNVTQIVQMFYHCDNLQTLDLSGWDLTNLRGNWPPTYELFSYCKSLNLIYMRGCNQNTIDKINRALGDVGLQNKVTIIT